MGLKALPSGPVHPLHRLLPRGMLTPLPVRQQEADLFRSVFEPYLDVAGGRLFLLILLNNTFATLMSLFGGVVLGILPVASAGINGFLLGVLFRLAAEQEGIGASLFYLLPHGIFKIPAIVLTAAYGLWIGMTFTRHFWKPKQNVLGDHARHAVRMHFRLILPLSSWEHHL